MRLFSTFPGIADAPGGRSQLGTSIHNNKKQKKKGQLDSLTRHTSCAGCGETVTIVVR